MCSSLYEELKQRAESIGKVAKHQNSSAEDSKNLSSSSQKEINGHFVAFSNERIFLAHGGKERKITYRKTIIRSPL